MDRKAWRAKQYADIEIILQNFDADAAASLRETVAKFRAHMGDDETREARVAEEKPDYGRFFRFIAKKG